MLSVIVIKRSYKPVIFVSFPIGLNKQYGAFRFLKSLCMVNTIIKSTIYKGSGKIWVKHR